MEATKVKPVGLKVGPEGAKVGLVGVKVKPEGAKVGDLGAKVKPETTKVKPVEAKVKPETTKVGSEGGQNWVFQGFGGFLSVESLEKEILLDQEISYMRAFL